METHFRYLTVNFNLHTGIKQPDMTSKDRFYKVYSSLKFKLKPRDNIYLDLRFHIETPETLQPWLNILPSLKMMGLHIENADWLENKTIDNTIQLHLLNKSFTYTIKIKTTMHWFYFFIRRMC